LRAASEAIEQGIELFRERGDLADASRAMAKLWTVLRRLGDPRWWQAWEEALTLLELQGPGRARAPVEWSSR
jgi:hypothetical protein